MDLVALGVLYALTFARAVRWSGSARQLGAPYWCGLGVAVLLVAYEFVIARHRDRDACFRAFLHNQWVGATVFAGIALSLYGGTR